VGGKKSDHAQATLKVQVWTFVARVAPLLGS
jgi:hypothetical protein